MFLTSLREINGGGAQQCRGAASATSHCAQQCRWRLGRLSRAGCGGTGSALGALSAQLPVPGPLPLILPQASCKEVLKFLSSDRGH